MCFINITYYKYKTLYKDLFKHQNMYENKILHYYLLLWFWVLKYIYCYFINNIYINFV